MNRLATFMLVLAAVGAARAVDSAAGRSRDSKSRAPRPCLIVLVFNTARAPAETLRAAESNAEDVFRRAGVGTQWIECSAAVDRPAPAICYQPLSWAGVVVRLIRKADAPKAHFGSHTLGFASVVGNERGAYATVFYDAVAAAESSESDLRLSLGHAMAHELGHLLLRSNEHSTAGVMRATWSRQDRALARSNGVVFLPEEAKRIQTEVRWRTAE